MILTIADAACIDTELDCRSISFENPTGARGAGGTALGGRKGAPAKMMPPGAPPVEGKEAIRRFIGELLTIPNFFVAHHMEAVNVSSSISRLNQ